MAITLRSEKGSALTYGEMDENFRIVREEYGLERILSIGNTANNDITVNNLNATTVNASGAIVQQAFARSGPAAQTIVSIDPVLITGLSITMTPLYADSIMSVEAVISTNNAYVSGYGVYKDGLPTVSTAGFTNTNQHDLQLTVYEQGTGGSAGDMYAVPIMHYETAGDLLPRTYGIYATSGWAGAAYTLIINNRNLGDMASFSYMTVKEIRP